nr:hypothetical protein [Tanacetum cinerariifolium]
MRGKGIVEPYADSVTRSENQALSVVFEAIDACSCPLGAYSECSSANGGSSDLPDVCGFTQITQQPSSFDGCSRSQPTATHVFTENLKRIIDSDALDRYSELCARNVKPRYLAIGNNYEYMPIGQPMSTSHVNVSVPVHIVGDGLNEPARFSEQLVAVESGHASRNVRMRLTLTESITPGILNGSHDDNNGNTPPKKDREVTTADATQNPSWTWKKMTGRAVKRIKRSANREQVFLEAVPLPLGRGVSVYISPPPYLVSAGLGSMLFDLLCTGYLSAAP